MLWSRALPFSLPHQARWSALRENLDATRLLHGVYIELLETAPDTSSKVGRPCA